MKRTINALAIIFLGIIILLINIDTPYVRDVLSSWWPLGLLGVAGLIVYNNPRNRLWALLVAVLGTILLLNTLDIVSVNIGDLIFPAILVTVGVGMLLNRSRHDAAIDDGTGLEEVSAILSGNSSKITTKDYEGSKVTAVLGGVELDLSKAKIKGEASLDVFVLMGGIELRVAEDVVVRNRTAAVLGGVESKTNPIESKVSPILYLDGQVVMGGIDIKR